VENDYVMQLHLAIMTMHPLELILKVILVYFGDLRFKLSKG